MTDECRNRDVVRLVFLFLPLSVSLLFCGYLLFTFVKRFRDLLTRSEQTEWENRLPGVFIGLVTVERVLRIGEVVLQYETGDAHFYGLFTHLFVTVVIVLVLYEQVSRLQSCFQDSIYKIPAPIVQRMHSLNAVILVCSTMWGVGNSLRGVIYSTSSQATLIFLATLTAILCTINLILIDFAFAHRLRKVVATQETMVRQSIGESPTGFGSGNRVMAKPKLKEMHLQTLSVFDSSQQVLLVVVVKHTILSQFLTLAMFLVSSAMIGFTLAHCVQPLAIAAHYCFAAGMSVICICGILGISGNQDEYDLWCRPCNQVMRKVVAFKTTRKMSRMSRADNVFGSGFTVRSTVTSPAGSPLPTPSKTNPSTQPPLMVEPNAYTFPVIGPDQSVGSVGLSLQQSAPPAGSGFDSSMESSMPDPVIREISSFRE